MFHGGAESEGREDIAGLSLHSFWFVSSLPHSLHICSLPFFQENLIGKYMCRTVNFASKILEFECFDVLICFIQQNGYLHVFASIATKVVPKAEICKLVIYRLSLPVSETLPHFSYDKAAIIR